MRPRRKLPNVIKRTVNPPQRSQSPEIRSQRDSSQGQGPSRPLDGTKKKDNLLKSAGSGRDNRDRRGSGISRSSNSSKKRISGVGAECESDRESGYGETLYAPSSDFQSLERINSRLHNHHGVPSSTTGPPLTSRSWTSPVRARPQSGRSVCSDTSQGDRDVLEAILQADQAMQRIMSDIESPQPGSVDEWLRNRRESILAAERDGQPVRVLYDENSLTDSIKQALKKATGDSMAGARGVNGDVPQGMLSVHVEHEDRYPPENDSYRSIQSGQYSPVSNTRLKHGMEVLQHEMRVSRQTLEPNTEFTEDEEEEAAFGGAYGEDDIKSWHSGQTEPDPVMGSVDSIDRGTQTLRHRTTQTPEDAATQTSKHARRRKLPHLPASREGSEAYISDLSTSFSSGESFRRHEEKSRKSRTRKKEAHKKRRESDPGLVSSYTVSEELIQRHPRTEGNTYSENATPRGPVDETMDPASERYHKQYQQYMQAFDGARTGPFVPGYSEQDDSVFLHSPSSRQGQYGISVPRYMPRDPAVNSERLQLQQGFQRPREPLSNITGTYGNQSGLHEEKDSRKATFVKDSRSGPPGLLEQHSWDVLNSDDQIHGGNIPGIDFQSQTLRNHKTQTPGYAATQTPRHFNKYGHMSTDTLGSYTSGSDPRRSVERQDFVMQTPHYQETQTPIRLGADHAGQQLPRGTMSLGETYVMDSDRGFIQPWSQLGSRDLGDVSVRHFSTQTFGQMLNTSHHHVETQTSPQDIPSTSQPTQTEQVMTRSVPFQAYSQPAKPGREHVIDEDEEDIFSERPTNSKPSKKSKKKKKKKKSKRAEKDTPDSQTSRKDVLKLMLHQVRSLRTAMDPDGTVSPDKPKHKKKHQHKEREESVLESPLEEGHAEQEYTRMRLALLDRTPRGEFYSEPESQRPRRRHSIESYHSESPQRMSRVSSRERYSSREMFSSRERLAGNRPNRYGSYFNRGRHDTPPRRAYTPPPRRYHSPYNRREYTPPPRHRPRSREYRDLPHKRRLPPAPNHGFYRGPAKPVVRFHTPFTAPQMSRPPMIHPQAAFRPMAYNTPPVQQSVPIPIQNVQQPVQLANPPVPQQLQQPSVVVIGSPIQKVNPAPTHQSSKEDSYPSELSTSLDQAGQAMQEMKRLTHRMKKKTQD